MDTQLEFVSSKVTSIETLLKELLANNKQDDIMDLSRAAKMLGVSEATIYSRVSKKQIPHYKPGGQKILFSRKELGEYIKANKVLTLDEEFHKAEQAMSKKIRKPIK